MTHDASPPPDALCIGSAHWDLIGRVPGAMPAGGDMPGRILRQPGGVALNIALTLRRLGLRPALLSLVGLDREGHDLAAACEAAGVDPRYLTRRADLATDRYMAIEDAGGLIAAVADAASLEAAGAAILAPLGDGRLGTAALPWAGLVALDGNLTEGLLADIATSPLLARADLRVAPASPGKAARLTPFLAHSRATLYLNLAEASILAGRPCPGAPEAAAALMDRGARHVLVTDGARPAAEGVAGCGVIAASPPQVRTARVTGAGDSFMAAHVAACLAGAGRDEALARAVEAATLHVSRKAGP